MLVCKFYISNGIALTMVVRESKSKTPFFPHGIIRLSHLQYVSASRETRFLSAFLPQKTSYELNKTDKMKR